MPVTRIVSTGVLQGEELALTLSLIKQEEASILVGKKLTIPFGYPLTYWFTCQGSLGIFVILIFWFANRQEKIDEEFGFSERGDD